MLKKVPTTSVIADQRMKAVRKSIKMCAMTILGLGIATSSAQAITITPNDDGEDLVNSILGEGINVVPGSVNYTGAAGASGTFVDGDSSIGIETGIIMTSGQAAAAVGPNDSDQTSTPNGTAGDADLDDLVTQGTNDAVVLEFDFESEGGDLFFEYVFASEEYNEFVNSSFNDVFAFFLDGENIALIPGTNTPVAINNVNGGNPIGTNATNPNLYNNNDPSDPQFDIEYDGFTDVFTASAEGLDAGTHTIKLALADTADSALDSAVFIKGGSFTDEGNGGGDNGGGDNGGGGDPEPIPEPTSMFGLMAVAYFGAGSFMKRKKH
ncbi:MAG: choice-of-anchor L domain-containing protein [Gomphosphaeria aponina SAG 52.96 = DSM 107014]|uniref:Choice-of-anchor L domain-containing protein n=1 Tax=Gomphosphaeria aponina SAG 52.96 = DSM 107014 TaxID=1521640 RepID=A0A941JUR5_9CHRO|nr:choice-of-anchor L domain-containing protein [Gomphosphaeria aponina SAG 52.96 = DSM 107014]